MKRILVIGIFLVLPFLNVFADHDCIEEIVKGKEIKVSKPFPKQWFKIGKDNLADSSFFIKLKTSYPNNYSESDDEGFSRHFCGLKNGIYINMVSWDYNCSAEFSKRPAKCWSCNKIDNDIEWSISGTGLSIGMNKKEVSKIIGQIIENDITAISFEEIIKGDSNRIWHEQSLRLVFEKEKLVCLSIDDYSEQYD